MTNLDNLIEYSDPEIYDLENGDFEPDGPFILSIAQELGSPVLELGCGTGRVTIPLAQNGIEIVGLDLVPSMLERAKQKAGDLPIQWVLADARSYQLDRKFWLIFESGSVFHHMLTRTDQEAYLARAWEHLEDDGRLIVNLFFPLPHRLTSTAEEEDWYTVKHPEGYEIRVSGTDRYDAVRQIRVETAYRRWTDTSGQEFVRVAPLSLRYVFPQEMETLMYYNGFEVVNSYGDTDCSPLTSSSQALIYVCRKRK
jgi:SAM-dependent methyltransferase